MYLIELTVGQKKEKERNQRGNINGFLVEKDKKKSKRGTYLKLRTYLKYVVDSLRCGFYVGVNSFFLERQREKLCRVRTGTYVST